MFINLMPHGYRGFLKEHVIERGPDFRLVPGAQPVLDVPRSDTVVRLEERLEQLPDLDVSGVQIPVFRKYLSDVVGMPPAVPGVMYIVSRMVAAALPERSDVFYPGPAVRDAEGNIIGALGLLRI